MIDGFEKNLRLNHRGNRIVLVNVFGCTTHKFYLSPLPANYHHLSKYYQEKITNAILIDLNTKVTFHNS